MRLTFTQEGGLAAFPGLSRPIVIELDALPSSDALQLRTLIEAVFRSGATAASDAADAPDARTYIIRIENGSRDDTLRFTDPVQGAAARALVQICIDHARHRRAAAPQK